MREFEVSDARKTNFGVIHLAHIDTNAFRDLSASARLVYIAILPFAGRYSGHAWPKISRIQEITGFSRATVHRGLRALSRSGYISIGKRQLSLVRRINLYTLLDPPQ